MSEERIVSATRVINAPADVIFEHIADPAKQPEWDGNDNLDNAAEGQRITDEGQAFFMTTTKGAVRENLVTEFDEGRLIAWKPTPVGGPVPGHLWRWELSPVADASDDTGAGYDGERTEVTHTYDWTELTDPARFERARWTTSDRLAASIDRLAELVEE